MIILQNLIIILAADRSRFSLRLEVTASFLCLPGVLFFSDHLIFGICYQSNLACIITYSIMPKLRHQVPSMNRKNYRNNVLPILMSHQRVVNATHIKGAHCRVIAMAMHHWHGSHLQSLHRQRGEGGLAFLPGHGAMMK